MGKLEVCMEAAMAGGLAIKDFRTSDMQSTIKVSKYSGSHAVVTPADYKSQEALLKVILGSDPEAYFITEEHVNNPHFAKRLIRKDTLELLMDNGAYIIDELDGTVSYRIGHYDWSVSVGFVNKDLKHIAGAIFAPRIDSGTLYYGAEGIGSFVKSGGETKEARVTSTKDLKDAYVLLGIDSFLTKYPVHNSLLTVLGDEARAVNVAGSCALGLAIVAAGNADALIQPLQSSWDWAAGNAILEQARGKIIFYRIGQSGNIIRIEKPELCDYDPDEKAVGFVAGNPTIASQIMEKLLEQNRRIWGKA